MSDNINAELLKRTEVLNKRVQRLETQEIDNRVGITSIEGVSNSGGNVDFVAVGGIAITGNDVANTVTFDTSGLTTDAELSSLTSTVNSHISNTSNPHITTATQVGALVSVDGVSNAGGNIDLIPAGGITITSNDGANTITIGTTGLALDADLDAHVADTANPHATTATQVGALVSVDGVSNAGGNIDLIATDGITITPNDGANTITIGYGGGGVGTFVRVATADTITAQHSFSPGSAQPPFLLGANAQNQKVIGLEADKLDGKEAADFVFLQATTPGTPQSGNLNISGTALAGVMSAAIAGFIGLSVSGTATIGTVAGTTYTGLPDATTLQKGIGKISVVPAGGATNPVFVGDNDPRMHSQNTDIGTTSSTFGINTGGTGVKIKDNGGVLESRNPADSAYADFKAANINANGGIVQLAGLTVLQRGTAFPGSPSDGQRYHRTTIYTNGEYDSSTFAGPAAAWYEVGKAVVDSFVRADSATTLGSTDNNLAWVPFAGTWGISSNKAYSASDTDDDAVLLDTYTTNPTLQVVVRGKVNSGDTRVPGVAFRGKDNSNYLLVQLVLGDIYFYAKTAGTFNFLAAASQTSADSTDYIITIVCTGLLVKVYVDGTLKITHTLSSTYQAYAGYTLAGMRLGKSGSPGATVARWSNFVVRHLVG